MDVLTFVYLSSTFRSLAAESSVELRGLEVPVSEVQMLVCASVSLSLQLTHSSDMPVIFTSPCK